MKKDDMSSWKKDSVIKILFLTFKSFSEFIWVIMQKKSNIYKWFRFYSIYKPCLRHVKICIESQLSSAFDFFDLEIDVHFTL